jgi:hypothetical protein
VNERESAFPKTSKELPFDTISNQQLKTKIYNQNMNDLGSELRVKNHFMFLFCFDLFNF